MNCLYPWLCKVNFKDSHRKILGTVDPKTMKINLTDKLEVRCNHCIPCIENKSKLWSYRLMAEKQSHNKISFITLTYDDDNLPEDGSLYVDHVQKFWKRVRRYYSYHCDSSESIAYFLSGEYGSEKFRPHYHFLCLGLDASDFLLSDISIASDNSKNAKSRFWDYGLINFGTDVSLNDQKIVRYVSKYVNKIDSDNLKKFCRIMGLKEPFLLTSKGIASDFFEFYFNPSDGSLPSLGGLSISMPNYWRKKFGYEYTLLDFKKFHVECLKTDKKREELLKGSDMTYAELVESQNKSKEALYAF